MMPEGKDPSNKHFAISIAKSAVRFVGCFLAIALDSVAAMALFFLVAEILGVYEEL
jgi:hypothetical protein